MYPALLGAATPNVFSGSTFYEGTYNGSFNTITIGSGIDLSTEGLVYSKALNTTGDHHLFDTIRGINQVMATNNQTASSTYNDSVIEFGTNSYRFGVDPRINTIGNNYLTFAARSAAQFLDIVTYSGDGTTNRGVPHNLGAAPGLVIIKAINDPTRNWIVWHKDLGPNDYLLLNSSTSVQTSATVIAQAPDSSNFYISGNGSVNSSANTYMAYVFGQNPALNISCGSYTGSGAAGNKQTIGFKPKMLIIKGRNTGFNWNTYAQALPNSGSTQLQNYVNLDTNTSAIDPGSAAMTLQTDGFTFTGATSNVSTEPYIYIAIG